MEYHCFPSLLVLHDVECADRSTAAAGGFADVFCGRYHGSKVALKCLRTNSSMSEDQKEQLKKVRLNYYTRRKVLTNSVVLLPRISAVEESGS